ncbi:MAG TPA: transglutaminase family protein [Devosia sp.]|nr:transglutaminase family protein [Devosia sp.]
MRYSVGCSLPYTVVTPATMILNVEPLRGEQQRIIRERFTVTPQIGSEPHRAGETGNLYRRLVLPPGSYTVRYEGEVEMLPSVSDPQAVDEVPISELPLEVLPYLYPSRFCPSDMLGRFAWRQFGEIAPGHERVAGICNWIYEYVDYLGGSSNSSTSAHDTFTQRAGVCRDFAHLGISFCRALGIPARFVSAYGWKLEPQDFHAVFEAYLGGRWYLFDATRLCPIDAIVRIGVGRDAADTSFSTFYGQVDGGFKDVWVNQVGGRDDDAAWTTEAVSVARE